jgi:hypothetical protein
MRMLYGIRDYTDHHQDILLDLYNLAVSRYGEVGELYLDPFIFVGTPFPIVIVVIFNPIIVLKSFVKTPELEV